MTQLRSVTCHMGSHSVTCYPTQVNTSRLNPSHTGWYSIYKIWGSQMTTGWDCRLHGYTVITVSQWYTKYDGVSIYYYYDELRSIVDDQ